MDRISSLTARNGSAHGCSARWLALLPTLLGLAALFPNRSVAQVLPWNWAATLDAGNVEYVRDIAIEPVTGNIYLAGAYQSAGPTIGPFGLPGSNGGSLDAFIVKLDPAGNPIWSRRIGGTQEDAALGIAVSSSGHIALTGYSRGDIAGIGTTGDGSADAFVATFEADGTFIRVRQVKSPSADEGTGVVFVGNTLVAYGRYTHDASLTGITPAATLTAGRSYAYLNAYAPNGDLLWSWTGVSNNNLVTERIATDGTSVYLVGGTQGNTMEWRNPWGALTSAQTTVNVNALFCSSFSGTGSHLWTRMINNPGDNNAECSGVAVDCGVVYITGHTHNGSTFPSSIPYTILGVHDYMFVAGLNKANGNTQWVRTASSNIDHGVTGFDLALGDKGQVYMAGTAIGNVAMDGGQVLNGSATHYDLLLARFNRDGTLIWVDRPTSPDDELAMAIASTGDGNLIVGGAYENGLTLGPLTYPGSNGSNAFTASFTDPEWANCANDPSRFRRPLPVCAGSANIDLSLVQLAHATAVISSTSVTTPENALDAPNGIGAMFNVTGGSAVFDLLDTLPVGEAIGITWRRQTSSSVRMLVSSSLDGINWTPASAWTTSSSTFTLTYPTLTASARYLRIVRDGSTSFGTFQVDAIRTNARFQAGGTWSGGPYITAAGVFSPSIAGSGSHPVTYTVSLAGCTYSTTYRVVVSPPPSATLSGPTQVCPGGNGVFSVVFNNVEQYRWQRRTAGVGAWNSFNNSQTSLSLTFTEATELRVEVRSPGCANTVFSNVLSVTLGDVQAPELPALPDLSITAPVSACSTAVIFTLPTATDNCTTCDPGTVTGYTRLGVFQGHAYYISNTTAQWPAANTAASATGGHLVYITSAAENTWLAGQTAGIEVFIGMSDAINEGVWLWGDGEPLTYTNWAFGQPDDLFDQDFGAMNIGGAGRWADVGGFLPVPRRHVLEFDCAVWQTGGPAPNTTLAVGTHTVTYSAQDASGNQSQQQFQIAVQDVTPPVITMPTSAITIPATGYPSCSGMLPDLTVQANVTDACPTNRSQRPAAGTLITGATSVWLIASDASGNRDSVAVMVQLTDVTTPVIVNCPNPVSLTVPVAGDAAMPYIYAVPVGNDCSPVTATLLTGLMPGANFPIGDTEVRWRIADASGNFSECVFTVTVGANDAPQLTCPTLPPVANTDASCAAMVTFAPPVAIDAQDGNIPATLVAGSLPPGSAFPLGNSIVTYTAQDTDGNVATCSFTVTVVDAVPPSITCPPALTATTTADACEVAVSWPSPTFSDNCFNCPPEANFPDHVLLGAFGYHLVSIGSAAENAALDAFKQSFGVEYNWIGLSDAANEGTFVWDSGEPLQYANWMFDEPNNISDEDGVMMDGTGQWNDIPTSVTLPYIIEAPCTSYPAQTSGAPNGSLFGVGQHTIGYTVTDGAGQTSSCSFTLTVTDLIRPVAIDCPEDIVVHASPGQCGAVVTYPTPVFSDACGIAEVTLVSGPASGSFFPVGTTVIRYQARDVNGNLSPNNACVFWITVMDAEPPVLATIDTLFLEAGTGCQAVVEHPAPTITSNCSNCSMAPPPMATDLGSYDGRRFFLVNTAVNWAQANQLAVQAGGHLPFVRNAAMNTWLRNAVNTATAPLQVPIWLGMTDAAVDSTFEFTNGTQATYFNWNTWEPNNSGGNEDYVSMRAGGGWNDELKTTTMPYVIEFVSNCGQPVVIAGPADGEVIPLGTSSATLQVTDASGLSTTQTYAIIVEDTTPPVFSNCPPAVDTLFTNTTTCVVTYTFPTINSEDPCDPDTEAGYRTYLLREGSPHWAEVTGMPSVQLTVGLNELFEIHTDDAGNADTCFWNLVVVDTVPPVVQCPNDMVVTAANGSCTAAVAVPGPVLVQDNCSGLTWTSDSFNNPWPIGDSTVTITAFDGSGNVSTCSFQISVQATPLPNLSYGAGPFCVSLGTVVPVAPMPAGGTFSCLPAPSSPIETTGLLDLSTLQPGANTITYTPPTGSCYTAYSVQTTIVVVVPTAPAITPSGPLSFCEGGNVVLSSSATAGNVWNTGATTPTIAVSTSGEYSVTVTDASGCSAISSPVQVIVHANPATPIITASGPLFFCPGGSVTLTSTGNSGHLWSNGATTPSIVVTNSGTFTVTLTDANGCSATSATTNVQVQDVIPPSITCPPTLSATTNTGCSATAVTLGTPVVADNCAVASVSNNAPTAFPLGATTVIWTVTDAIGNSNTCSQSVVVIDTTLPTITCPGDIGVNALAGTCEATVTFPSPVFTDNCPGRVLTQESGLPSGSMFPVGSTTNLFRVTAANGQIRECHFSVTVFDVEGPTITAPDIAVTAAAGTCAAQVSWPQPTVTDNCAGCPSTSTPSGFTELGTYQGRRYLLRNSTELWAAANASHCRVERRSYRQLLDRRHRCRHAGCLPLDEQRPDELRQLAY